MRRARIVAQLARSRPSPIRRTSNWVRSGLLTPLGRPRLWLEEWVAMLAAAAVIVFGVRAWYRPGDLFGWGVLIFATIVLLWEARGRKSATVEAVLWLVFASGIVAAVVSLLTRAGR